jgi:hypothetical protein
MCEPTGAGSRPPSHRSARWQRVRQQNSSTSSYRAASPGWCPFPPAGIALVAVVRPTATGRANQVKLSRAIGERPRMREPRSRQRRLGSTAGYCRAQSTSARQHPERHRSRGSTFSALQYGHRHPQNSRFWRVALLRVRWRSGTPARGDQPRARHPGLASASVLRSAVAGGSVWLVIVSPGAARSDGRSWATP